jgi:hypothetical protein
MKLHWIAAFFATLMAAGCSAHGTSGTYISRGRGFVEMLQITQAQDGQLLGSLASTALNPDGSITHGTTNITGVADGHAITLVAKSPIPLFPGLNMPGTIESGVDINNFRPLVSASGHHRCINVVTSRLKCPVPS